MLVGMLMAGPPIGTIPVARSRNSHFAKVYVFKPEFIPFCIVSLVPKILNSLDKLCESCPPLSCSLALKL